MSSLDKLIPLVDCDYPCYSVGFSVGEEEPVSHVLYNTKRWITSVLDRFPDRPHHEAYLGGEDNFRVKVATIKPYKGHRSKDQRPFYFQEIREYLEKEWEAVIVNGREADDEIGERQFTSDPETTCIVSVDKDMLQIPGWNYNPKKCVARKISRETADLFFFYQVIQGDSTDNIPGLYRYGKKKAAEIVRRHRSSISNLKKEISGLYKKEFGDKWQSVIHEVSTLLFIHREPGKTYIDYFGSW